VSAETTAPLLVTKLHVPPSRPGVVDRPRLIEQLNEGVRTRLTLVSASAGFGKTTLVGEWAAACRRPVAWLSLDERDDDPSTFLTYLVAALRTIAPDIGKAVATVLQSPQPPPIEAVLTTLLNEIATIADEFVLVLDDYHVLDSKPDDDVLVFLLENLPPQMHLVIATREDPRLPLARWRARGHLTELRAAELRFTPAEATEFLERAMGLDLSPEDIAALDARTEGWIAGLQMAAISIQGIPDAPGFIRSFTGSHRFVLDYLLEEVLERQPFEVRTFLLRTAALTACAAPCAMRSCSPRPAPGRRPCGPSSAQTCSSSPSTTTGAGTAITTSSATCCATGSNEACQRRR
jgi:LuxR family maltose regulon positive regulatory protein